MAKKMAKKMKDKLARALELLDNCVIAIEREDPTAAQQAGGAAREFLDTLDAKDQALFRDWHEPGVHYKGAHAISKLG